MIMAAMIILNCPLSKDEYYGLVDAVIAARKS